MLLQVACCVEPGKGKINQTASQCEKQVSSPTEGLTTTTTTTTSESSAKAKANGDRECKIRAHLTLRLMRLSEADLTSGFVQIHVQSVSQSVSGQARHILHLILFSCS